jgi:hypothetical protein
MIGVCRERCGNRGRRKKREPPPRTSGGFPGHFAEPILWPPLACQPLPFADGRQLKSILIDVNYPSVYAPGYLTTSGVIPTKGADHETNSKAPQFIKGKAGLINN